MFILKVFWDHKRLVLVYLNMRVHNCLIFNFLVVNELGKKLKIKWLGLLDIILPNYNTGNVFMKHY